VTESGVNTIVIYCYKYHPSFIHNQSPMTMFRWSLEMSH